MNRIDTDDGLPKSMHRAKAKDILHLSGLPDARIANLVCEVSIAAGGGDRVMRLKPVPRIVRSLLDCKLIELYDPTTGDSLSYDETMRLKSSSPVRRTTQGNLAYAHLTTPYTVNLPVRERGVRMKYGADRMNPFSKATKTSTNSVTYLVKHGANTIEQLVLRMHMSAMSATRIVCFMLHYEMLELITSDGRVIPFDQDTALTKKSIIRLPVPKANPNVDPRQMDLLDNAASESNSLTSV